jgi:hypothetical protein
MSVQRSSRNQSGLSATDLPMRGDLAQMQALRFV